jgi:hypothetical protein
VIEEGWCVTRFKQHLTGRGNNVKHCSCVPPDVRNYFRHDLDRTADRKKTKNKERLLREEVAAQNNVLHDIDSDDEELQRALHASREEAQHERVARQQGGQYEHDGGSSQKQGVACLEGSRGQAHGGCKPLKRKHG